MVFVPFQRPQVVGCALPEAAREEVVGRSASAGFVRVVDLVGGRSNWVCRISSRQNMLSSQPIGVFREA